jgi:hypothetical protein
VWEQFDSVQGIDLSSILTQPKKRTLRRPDDVIISEPGHRNNGNIEIIDEDTRQRLAAESVYINGKRYRVPEKVIQVDFWTKIGQMPKPTLATDFVECAKIKAGTLITALYSHRTPPPSRKPVTAAQLFDSHSPLSTVPSTIADDDDGTSVGSEVGDDIEGASSAVSLLGGCPSRYSLRSPILCCRRTQLQCCWLSLNLPHLQTHRNSFNQHHMQQNWKNPASLMH